MCGEGETKTVGTVSKVFEATASEKGAVEPYSSQEADQRQVIASLPPINWQESKDREAAQSKGAFTRLLKP